jgi:hypothetical protein
MSDLIFPSSGALPVGNYIYPGAGGSADYGLLHDFYQIGGYQVLPTISERNAIPITQPKTGMPYIPDFIDPTGFASGRRKIGMIVYVQETDETYRLIPKGYFGNGGTGATGDATSWLALASWEKAVLLDPAIVGVSNENLLGLDQNFNGIYEGVTGSGNPDDCWVRVSTETEVTYVEPAEISANVYGGTASKGILEYSSSITYLVKFPTTNTGPITLSIDGFEALDVKKVNANGVQPLVNGEIDPDIVYPVFYDGTQFQIQVFETAPISVFGPTGNLLTAGLTGLNFIGTGVSASAVGGFVTIDFTGGSGGSGFVYPNDLTVSLSATKSFGRYVDGDIIPAQGKTPAEVIVLALSESIAPIVSLSTSTTVPLPFGITNVNNNIDFSHTILTLGATASSAVLEFRRGTGSWTTLSTDTASSGTYVHTNTNTLWDTTNYNYKYTVTDSTGASGYATLTIPIAPYVSPTIPISVTGSSLTAPEINSKREIGNVSSVISSTITRNSPLVDLQSYRILCQTNGAGSFNEIDSGALSASSDTISYTHNDASLDTSTSLVYKIEVTDEYDVNNSANSTVNFQYLIFCGPVAVTPTNSAGVRALTTRYFADSTSNPFILNTGNVYNRFTAAMPATKTISLVMDLEVNANLTPTYTGGLSTFNVNTYSGDSVSYKVYTMNPAIAYTFSHRHQITFTP